MYIYFLPKIIIVTSRECGVALIVKLDISTVLQFPQEGGGHYKTVRDKSAQANVATRLSGDGGANFARNTND